MQTIKPLIPLLRPITEVFIVVQRLYPRRPISLLTQVLQALMFMIVLILLVLMERVTLSLLVKTLPMEQMPGPCLLGLKSINSLIQEEELLLLDMVMQVLMQEG